MYGDAAVRPDYFDAIVDEPKYDFPLFAPPNLTVSTADYLIALHVSALIRDGGTLQLGIGSIGDAITYLLKLRHEENDTYRDFAVGCGNPRPLRRDRRAYRRNRAFHTRTLRGHGNARARLPGTSPVRNLETNSP